MPAIPVRVLARRLSNAEYNDTIRDLTGVDIQPAREFPVDPANTEGFDNSGESLTMSPSLFNKYLQAARQVSEHMVLTPDGIDFAPHPMLAETDRDRYSIQRILDFYARQPTDVRRLLRGRVALQAPRGARTAARIARGRSPPRRRSAPNIWRRSGAFSRSRRNHGKPEVGPSRRCRRCGGRCRRRRRQCGRGASRASAIEMREFARRIRQPPSMQFAAPRVAGLPRRIRSRC